MIESIEREDTKLVIKVNTGLNVKGHILILRWDAEKETFAELLKYQLWDELDKFKHKIALNPHYYLEPKEISKLKSKLVKEWNGSKHDWKRGN